MTADRFAIHNRIAQLREHHDACLREARDMPAFNVDDGAPVRAALEVADFLLSRARDRAAHDPALALAQIALVEAWYENNVEPLIDLTDDKD